MTIKTTKYGFIQALDKLEELEAIANKVNVSQYYTISQADRDQELKYIALNHGLSGLDVDRLKILIRFRAELEV